MDYKYDIIIKHEKEDIREDKNDNYIQTSFDIKIEIENVETLEDWCIQNALPSTEALSDDLVSYEELTKQRTQACIICRKIFADSFSLLCHNLNHLKVPLIQRRLFICDSCPNFYKNKTDLENHITSEHKLDYSHLPITKQPHNCQLCKKTYTYKNWFSHMKEVHGQLDLKCNQCNLRFKCERYLKKHIKLIHEGLKRKEVKKKLQCPKCPSILFGKYALTTHLRNCHSEAKYTCSICKSTLKCRSYLLAHMQRVHYNDGVFHQCDVCGKAFKSPRYVNVHIKNAHYKNKS